MRIPVEERPLLFWRETSAESFPTRKGDFPHGVPSARLWRVPETQCKEAPTWWNPYNNLTNAVMKSWGYTILPVHEVSRVGWRDLRGWHYRLDCVHYCMPSGVLDYWVDVLVEGILDARAV